MEWEDLYNATLAALEEHARKRAEDAPTLSTGLISIEPFDAENIDGERCKAVGIVTNPGSDSFDFIVLKEFKGGELVPTTEGSLWRLTLDKAIEQEIA